MMYAKHPVPRRWRTMNRIRPGISQYIACAGDWMLSTMNCRISCEVRFAARGCEQSQNVHYGGDAAMKEFILRLPDDGVAAAR